jgi:hypothetical protein
MHWVWVTLLGLPSAMHWVTATGHPRETMAVTKIFLVEKRAYLSAYSKLVEIRWVNQRARLTVHSKVAEIARETSGILTGNATRKGGRNEGILLGAKLGTADVVGESLGSILKVGCWDAVGDDDGCSEGETLGFTWSITRRNTR